LHWNKEGVALGFTEKVGKAHGAEEEEVKAAEHVQVLPHRTGAASPTVRNCSAVAEQGQRHSEKACSD